MRSPYLMNRKKRKALKMRMKRRDIFALSAKVRIDVTMFTDAMQRVQRGLEQLGATAYQAAMGATAYAQSLRRLENTEALRQDRNSIWSLREDAE
jgi:hypothetical protein